MKKLLFTCVIWLFSTPVLAIDIKDLLPPDEAFKLSTRVMASNQLELSWDIADGYYLYKDRLDFSSDSEVITLDPAKMPLGKLKQDPNFGEMEVYTQYFSLEIPIQTKDELILNKNNTTQHRTVLQAQYQGCADAGLCYPPQKKSIALTFDTSTKTLIAAIPQASSSPPSFLDTTATTTTTQGQPVVAKQVVTTQTPPSSSLPDLAGNIPNKTLPVEEAFQLALIALDRQTLVAQWEVEPEHLLYKSKIHFRVKSPEQVHLGAPVFPASRQIDDEFFGPMEVFEKDLSVSIPLQLPNPLPPNINEVVIETEYQGCSEATGICYPPVTVEQTIELANLAEKMDKSTLLKTQAAAFGGILDNSALSTTAQSEDYLTRLQGAGLLGTILLFFGVGLLLAFTPCIFPMIPILSGVIVGQTNISARKAFLLSLAYVLASASAYAVIGIFFGLFGANLQAVLQHPIAIASFAGLFVILALSMFGFYDLQMPNSLQSRLNELSSRQRGGSLLGAAVMGFLSTLIVGPCVAPPLAGALTYIAQTNDAILGGAALFSMGFAMGLPLLIVGTSAGHLLPHAGAWMDTTKAIFGIMMLGLAIWMLDRIVPQMVTMALTATLLVASGIYMGALDRLDSDASGWTRFWKSIGMIMLFYGALQFLGLALGSQSILHPLRGFFVTTSSVQEVSPARKTSFQPIRSVGDLELALQLSKQTQQFTILDFYADWCTDCIRMERNTFSNATVQTQLNQVKLLKADVTAQNTNDTELQRKFGIIGPPTLLFFDKNGLEIKDLRLVGYENATAFSARLQRFQSR